MFDRHPHGEPVVLQRGHGLKLHPKQSMGGWSFAIEMSVSDHQAHTVFSIFRYAEAFPNNSHDQDHLGGKNGNSELSTRRDEQMSTMARAKHYYRNPSSTQNPTCSVANKTNPAGAKESRVTSSVSTSLLPSHHNSPALSNPYLFHK